MAQHAWIARAHALRTPFFQASRAVHTTHAAVALQGLASTVRAFDHPPNAFPFTVSQRALVSHGMGMAVLWDTDRAGRWEDAPWALFAHNDRSAFAARKMDKGQHRVLPCTWTMKRTDLAAYGLPDRRLALHDNPNRPRLAWAAEHTGKGSHALPTQRLTDDAGLPLVGMDALHKALVQAGAAVAHLGKTQPLLNTTHTGLVGDGPFCAPFLAVELGTEHQRAVRTAALLERAWALGVRHLTVAFPLVGHDRAPVWSTIDARAPDGSPMPAAAGRILVHLRAPHQGLEPWVWVYVGDRGRARIEPDGLLHHGPVPDPRLSAHALLSVLQDIPL